MIASLEVHGAEAAPAGYAKPTGYDRTMASSLTAIPVIIVAFRNAADVNGCLRALCRMEPTPPFAIFICENGGADAFDDLVATLAGPAGVCAPDAAPPMLTSPRLTRITRLRLPTGNPARPISVHLGEACDNLGYAGGVNAFLDPLLAIPGWPGVWILNPDTEPAAGALAELVHYAAAHDRGMVGSRLCARGVPDVVVTRGLAWRKWRAATTLVDRMAPAATCPPPEALDARLDSPSGASLYVTRTCIARIGLMDERYFLYFEDLDWGLRAKRQSGIGYAHRSIVVHDGGTTIGGGQSRRGHSALAVYLDFRNRLLFARTHFAGWMPWIAFIELLEILEYARVRAFRNMLAAVRGMTAGIAGRTGRPDHIVRAHRAPARHKTP